MIFTGKGDNAKRRLDERRDDLRAKLASVEGLTVGEAWWLQDVADAARIIESASLRTDDERRLALNPLRQSLWGLAEYRKRLPGMRAELAQLDAEAKAELLATLAALPEDE